jgi:putative ATPase
LASAPKSNASYVALTKAREDAVAETLPVPLHLRNAPTGLMKNLGYGREYRYPHDDEGAINEQIYLPEKLADHIYYQPSERGYEIRIREWVARARQMRAKVGHARPPNSTKTPRSRQD